MRFINDLYSEKYTDIEADVIMCRHTLEHIGQTGEFIRMIRRAIGERKDMLVLFELPDVTRVLKENAFWDVYYEHCSYFSPGSLARLFRANNFDVARARARLRRSVSADRRQADGCADEAVAAAGERSGRDALAGRRLQARREREHRIVAKHDPRRESEGPEDRDLERAEQGGLVPHDAEGRRRDRIRDRHQPAAPRQVSAHHRAGDHAADVS